MPLPVFFPRNPLLALLPLAAVLFFFTLTACQIRPVKSDPDAALRLWSQAEERLDARDFAAAADSMAQAAAADPTNLQLAYRRGEILEMNADPDGAAAIYQEALQRATPADPLRLELAYQLALVQCFKLQHPGEAARYQSQLPASDPRHSILTAALAIASNNPRTALLQLNLLRNQPLAQPIAARAAYVAAVAYLRLGEKEQATAALYRAINLAGKTLIAYDIEQLWQQVKGTATH